MRIRRTEMKVRNQTDPNLQQLSIIASKVEWMALIEACNFEDDAMAQAWREGLFAVVVGGENQSQIDTRDLQNTSH